MAPIASASPTENTEYGIETNRRVEPGGLSGQDPVVEPSGRGTGHAFALVLLRLRYRKRTMVTQPCWLKHPNTKAVSESRGTLKGAV